MKTEPYCEFMATHEKIDTDDPESNSDEAIAVEFQLVRSVQRGDYHSVCNILSTISERDSVSEKSLKESLDISVSLRNREITNRLLKFASQILKQQRSGQIQDVWPAYQETSEWTPIFVVMSYVWYPEDQYLGYRILWRKNDDVSSEGSIVANSAEVRENPLSYDEMIFMKKLIRTANLFKYHKNITVVNACPCKSRNGGKDISLEKCIVIYTHVKGLIPFDEQPFPKNIDGVPVDVREAYVKLGMYGGKVRTSYGRRVCHRENDADNESCSIPTCEASAVLIAADISMDNLSVDILSSSHILDTNKQNKDSGSQLLPDIDTQMFMDGMCSINIPETSPSLSNTPSVASMSDTSAVQPSGMRELPLSMREISLEQGMNTKGYYFPQTNVHKKRKFRHEYVYPMGPASPDQSQYMQHLELSAATAMEISSTVDEYSTNCTDTKTKAVQVLSNHGKKGCDLNENLLMGTEIGLYGNGLRGTLGAFVSLPNGEVGALTCAHVMGVYHGFCDEDVSKIVTQPSVGTSLDDPSLQRLKIGHLYKAVFDEGCCDDVSIDAAIIKVQSRLPEKAEFIETETPRLKSAGFEPSQPPSFTKGEILKFDQLRPYMRNQVIKYGSQSGLTQGVISMWGSDLRPAGRSMMLPNKQDVEFFNQIEILSVTKYEQFFKGGDSGSLVFMPLGNVPELYCIGLAVGWTSYDSCIVTPIENVFKKLDLPAKFIDYSNL